MARLLVNLSRLEVGAIIRFLWVKNVSASAMSRRNVAKLCHCFQSGRQYVESHNMTRSDRPSSSTTEIVTLPGKLTQALAKQAVKFLCRGGLKMKVVS
ncbi:hypothetical protein TNCV_631711 [Trichonephila clavipes]|nr:hypothetical protein TNCV_631711 [Trichonephila clavipes]